MQKKQKTLWIAIGFLAAFILWTLIVSFVEVKPIGPKGTSVGLATINGYFHSLTGVNFALYDLTDWLGLVPIFVCVAFGVLGLVQLIKRKSLKSVDKSILVLGGSYIATIFLFVLFEKLVINYRPVLIEGNLEASYPSSTTLLVMCVMPTAFLQTCERIKKGWLRNLLSIVILSFTAFMVIARLISGVHWLTDIIGGALFSIGLVTLYYYLTAKE